jgi:hypothetical protein
VTGRLTAAGVALVLIAGALAGVAGSGSSGTGQISAQESASTATDGAAAPAIVNRQDCTQIRGTDYLSAEERSWFLATCIQP